MSDNEIVGSSKDVTLLGDLQVWMKLLRDAVFSGNADISTRLQVQGEELLQRVARAAITPETAACCTPEAVRAAHDATPADQKEIIPLGCTKCSNVILMPAANGVCDIRKAEGWVWSIVEGWRCPAHALKASEEQK